MEKHLEYAAKLVEVVGLLFDEDSDYYLDPEELMEGNNLTEFFHALATVMPNHLYNKMTGAEDNNLQFNHIANQLCFQFSNNKD